MWVSVEWTVHCHHTCTLGLVLLCCCLTVCLCCTLAATEASKSSWFSEVPSFFACSKAITAPGNIGGDIVNGKIELGMQASLSPFFSHSPYLAPLRAHSFSWGILCPQIAAHWPFASALYIQWLCLECVPLTPEAERHLTLNKSFTSWSLVRPHLLSRHSWNAITEVMKGIFYVVAPLSLERIVMRSLVQRVTLFV